MIRQHAPRKARYRTVMLVVEGFSDSVDAVGM